MHHDTDTHPRLGLVRSGSLLGIAVALAFGGTMFAGVRALHHRETREALALFRAQSHENSRDVGTSVSDSFGQMYRGLRTIARLPGIRAIDRHATNFTADAKATVQEIYNNLATHVAMSEVYIVPLDLQPDRLDPQTGQLQVPITTFDQLIVGRTAESEGEQSEKAKPVEEVEIFEYRLMRAQLDYLKEHFPTEASIKGLEYPAVCGPEVVTCDNSRYDPAHPDDKDRAGLVYSVPFYGPDGSLRGCISGVILTHALRDLLPTGNYALVNKRRGFVATRGGTGTAEDSRAAVSQLVPNPALPYSEVLPVAVQDHQAEWALWAGAPVLAFDNSDAMAAARTSELWGFVACGAVAIGGSAITMLARRAYVQARVHASVLESEVQARTTDLREALGRAEAATHAKSAFLANMSHEIRTPMAAIIGYADLLSDPDQTIEQREMCVDTIRRNGRHLLAIINDILDLSKVEAGAMTVEKIDTDPVQIAEEVCSLLNVRAREKGIVLRLRSDSPVPRQLLSDPSRIRQILCNLVGNAIKFTQTGEVWLTLRVPADDPTTLRFEVRDTGIGMTPEQMTKLFQPFTQADDSMTRRFGGTGLGLTISKRLAELLGGDITVTSSPGVGSEFTFSLTLATRWTPETQTSTPETQPQPSDHQPLRGVRVLLTEDGSDNQRLFSHHLRRAGAAVVVAQNGLEGSDLALQAQSCTHAFHVVLMDMQMPVMDGYTAVARLRKAGYTGPVLALTAHAMNDDRRRCIEAGCDDFLTKPIDRALLIEACVRWARPAVKPQQAA